MGNIFKGIIVLAGVALAAVHILDITNVLTIIKVKIDGYEIFNEASFLFIAAMYILVPFALRRGIWKHLWALVFLVIAVFFIVVYAWEFPIGENVYHIMCYSLAAIGALLLSVTDTEDIYMPKYKLKNEENDLETMTKFDSNTSKDMSKTTITTSDMKKDGSTNNKIADKTMTSNQNGTMRREDNMKMSKNTKNNILDTAAAVIDDLRSNPNEKSDSTKKAKTSTASKKPATKTAAKTGAKKAKTATKTAAKTGAKKSASKAKTKK